MNKTFIPVLASILVLGAFSLGFAFDDVFAGKGDNNGNNGCEKSNPNSKACEKNPNTTPDPCDGAATCDYNGTIYCDGDHFPADDGCNACACSELGVACTKIACLP